MSEASVGVDMVEHINTQYPNTNVEAVLMFEGGDPRIPMERVALSLFVWDHNLRRELRKRGRRDVRPSYASAGMTSAEQDSWGEGGVLRRLIEKLSSNGYITDADGNSPGRGS